MAYKNAPIQEALFDVQIDKLSNPDLHLLELLHNQISNNFPKKKKKYKFTGKFGVEEGEVLSQEAGSSPIGVTFLSEDEKTQIQFRLDGFTFNVLKPYNNWDKHFKDAMTYWNLFKIQAKPNKITRIATRFINRIEIPFMDDSIQIKEYFKIVPAIPDELPKVFTNFFLQIQIPIESDNTKIILTQTTAPIENTILPYILDIDVFQEIDINVEEVDLFSRFNTLRKIKNNFFENCITNKTREIFQK